MLGVSWVATHKNQRHDSLSTRRAAQSSFHSADRYALFSERRHAARNAVRKKERRGPPRDGARDNNR